MADACGILASYSCLYMAVMRPTRWLITGLKEHQSGEGGIENHLYWIDFYEHHTDESGDENKDGDIELPRIVGGGEILFVAEKEGCGGKESYYSWAQASKCALHTVLIHIFHKHLTDENHQYESRENKGKGGCKRTKHTENGIACGIENGGIAAVSGGIDTERSWWHL